MSYIHFTTINLFFCKNEVEVKKKKIHHGEFLIEEESYKILCAREE